MCQNKFVERNLGKNANKYPDKNVSRFPNKNVNKSLKKNVRPFIYVKFVNNPLIMEDRRLLLSHSLSFSVIVNKICLQFPFYSASKSLFIIPSKKTALSSNLLPIWLNSDMIPPPFDFHSVFIVHSIYILLIFLVNDMK